MMKRSMVLLCCCVLLAAGAQAQNEEALVKAVKAKLDAVTDYEARGRMTIDVSFIQAPPSDVTVYYKKPDQFKVIKSDGITILPKGGVGLNMGSILSADEYTVVPAGTAVVNGTNTKVVKLLPQHESGDVVLMTLYIDEKATLIRRSKVTTRENGSYEIDLTYGKYAAWGLPDNVMFSFNAKAYKLPKGITFEYEKSGKPAPATPKDSNGKIGITYSGYKINKGLNAAVFAK
jgi:outer membrane lipoprotein-sorting protein